MLATAKPPAEFVVTETMKNGDVLSDVFLRLSAELAARDAEMLSLMIYGSLAVREAIDRALRDEGTSHHYLPPAEFAVADRALLDIAQAGLAETDLRVITGATWTTDAPYRETEAAIAAARDRGALAVEMEAAALYAFSAACARNVLCFAHVTNQMAQIEGDFEKGEAGGAHDAILLLVATARAWSRT
jgi:uridine phosphorylase